MTHADIFKKFMIEYDKANTASSYPSLTDYEIATILNKAYLALIDQKITGNTTGTTIDTSTILSEDIAPLITRFNCNREPLVEASLALNEVLFRIDLSTDKIFRCINGMSTVDGKKYVVHFVTENIALKYKTTATNLPWLSNPVAYLEGLSVHLLVDGDVDRDKAISLYITAVKKPIMFTDSTDKVDKKSTFELRDDVAEELINLAIIMSLEIVESTRLESKVKISALES